MALVGRALLILGLLVAFYGIGASLYGAIARGAASGSTPDAAPCTRSPG